MPLPQSIVNAPKQRLFLSEYLKDFNGVAALLRAGYKANPNVAAVQANRLLNMPNIKALLAQHLKDAAVAGTLTLNRVLREYMRLGLSDIRDVVTLKDGKMTVKDTSEWSSDAAAAVSEVTQVTVERGKDGYTNKTTTLKLKLHSKAQAMEGLAKHLEMFQDIIVNNSLQVNVSISDLAKLVHPDRDDTQATALPAPADDDNRVLEGQVSDDTRTLSLETMPPPPDQAQE